MSKCGCGQPNNPRPSAVRRVDVETILLCDVLADGTVAGVALVEPLYDTITGNRLGTRTVDPATGAPYTPRGTLRPCEPETCTASTSTQVLCDIAADGNATAFVRATTYGCDGELLATLDRTLDGAAYSPTGTVDTCPSPCRTSNTEMLCDSAPVPLDLSVGYLPLTEAPVDVPNAREYDIGPADGQRLWDGHSVTFGPTNEGHGLTYGVGAIAVGRTDCGEPDDTVRLRVSLNVTFNGPTPGQGSTGGLQLLNGNTALLERALPASTRVGWTGALTFATDVLLSDVEAGNIRLRLGAETNQAGRKSWTFTDFSLTGELTGTGCGRRFLRTYLRDCLTGEITGIVDNDLDGTPYNPVGNVTVCAEGPPCDEPPSSPCQRYDVEPLLLCDTGPDGTVTPFLRHLVYSGFSGALDGTRDTTLDGSTPYAPTEGGTVGECCEPTYETICVTPLVPSSTRVVSNPGNDMSGRVDPAWTWGPTPAGGRPVYDVPPYPAWQTPMPPDGGWVGINPDRSTSGLPNGPSDYYMVASFTLPSNAVLDATSLRIDTLNADDNVLGYSLNGGPETPTPPQRTRFVDPPYTEQDHRVAGAVTGRNTLAIRVREFTAPSAAGALLDVTLTYRVAGTAEYWTVAHDCDGTTTYIAPDGTRYPGALPDTAIPCEPAQDCCQPVQVCVTDTVTETIEFISNEAQIYDNSLDSVWTWTPDGDASGPAANAIWYVTYRARFAPNPAAWSVTDSAPTRKAGWVTPHPDGLTRSTGAPGEGPPLSGSPTNPMRWWARASFSLPAAADPESIRVQITVLNADQVANRFRLNDGAWLPLPSTASHNGTAYTFGPATIPGARPGMNVLYFEAQETVIDNPNNGAGVMAHFIVSYDVPGLGKRSWTRMVCCDDSVYYLDENGDRQDGLPLSSSLVPCDSGADPLVLCDDNGTFLRYISHVGDQARTTDTDLNGEPYTPIGTVRSCADR